MWFHSTVFTKKFVHFSILKVLNFFIFENWQIFSTKNGKKFGKIEKLPHFRHQKFFQPKTSLNAVLKRILRRILKIPKNKGFQGFNSQLGNSIEKNTAKIRDKKGNMVKF